MPPLTSSLVKILNSRFRPSAPTLPACFPGHEFNEDEAARLAKFCDRIAAEGYDFVYHERNDKSIRDLLDLAAGYGCFVEETVGYWYLGIFLIAECVMEPYASESFSSELFRSRVFSSAPQAAKDLTMFLMVIAIICDRPETAATRFSELLTEAINAKCPLSQIALEQILTVGSPQSDISNLKFSIPS